ncbi:MAG: hypothetical protein JNM17_05565 [Archangium sp.]|nr:hypothetical protein [Archangium sp.]
MKIHIAAPCTEKWEAMTGNDRQRHCASCKLNVFNTKELTEAELEALLTKTEGRVCGRVYQRADGTVLTRDCPTGVAKLRKRALAAMTMAGTLVLAVIGFGFLRSKGAACPSDADDEEQTWFDRVVTTRAVEAREELRETKTLGPLVNKVFPVPVVTRVKMGKMKYVPPTTASAPASPSSVE